MVHPLCHVLVWWALLHHINVPNSRLYVRISSMPVYDDHCISSMPVYDDHCISSMPVYDDHCIGFSM